MFVASAKQGSLLLAPVSAAAASARSASSFSASMGSLLVVGVVILRVDDGSAASLSLVGAAFTALLDSTFPDSVGHKIVT